MKKLTLFLSIFIFLLINLGRNLYAADLYSETQFYNIVIFIKFADENNYHAPHDYNYYESMFNGEDIPSLRDYYLEVSYDYLTIDSYIVTSTQNVITYYQDTNDRGYYEPYDEVTNPIGYQESESTLREHNLLARAVNYVDEMNLVPDTLDLDKNKDGDIDSITFMVSGEDTGWSSLLWPHMWSLYSVNASINGYDAYNYTFELLGNSPTYHYAVDVGVLAHETFHLIGAPDLYHYYRYDTVHPVDEWGLMEYNGTIPSHMLGYMKYQYGKWIESVPVISASGSYTLYPMQDDPNNVYKIDTGQSNEWIYLEYRNNEGLYESNLPDFGLIVYRVDLDYYPNGNVDGYYDEYGWPANEVYVFRPGISDTTEPYTFVDDGNDVDGNPDEAALSQYNLYDSIGFGTSIPIFGSDGYELPITISNVVEHDGYITFDVNMSPRIDVMQDGNYTIDNELTLFDHPLMDYEVMIYNAPVDATIYYTTDGTEPNFKSPIFDGSPLKIDANNNQIRAKFYVNVILTDDVTKNFVFEDSIESNHNPYGDNVNKTWYLDFGSDTHFKIDFNNSSETEKDYDFLYLFNDVVNYKLSGNQFSNLLDITDSYLYITFTSDDYLDDYYGFKLEFIFDSTSTADLILNGAQSINFNIGDEFTDEGYELINASVGDYVLVTNNVDFETPGTYYITYEAYDINDQLIKRIFRTIHVGDFEAPEIELIGPSTVYIEYGDPYIEYGMTYSDNYDMTGTLVIDHEIAINTLGTYYVTYRAYDSSFNYSVELVRTVIIRDTTPPVIELNGLETVYVEYKGVYRDLGVTFTDLQTKTPRVVKIGTVDTSVLGTYIITYEGIDDSNNHSEILTRTVIVRDSTIPIITLIGDQIVTIEYLSDYQELGAIVFDNYDHDIEVVIGGDPVETDFVGTYEVVYSYTDSSGNQAVDVIRTVIVSDTIAPVARINPGVDTVFVGSSYEDPGVTHEEGSSLAVEGLPDIETVGSYLVTYTVTDNNQNQTILYRYVHVIEKTSYDVSFELESAKSTLFVDEAYVDASCVILIDGNEFICESTNNIDQTTSGTYEVTYAYTYQEITYTYTRYVRVIVKEELTPIILFARKESELTIHENR